MKAALADRRPSDGYFVEFWRLLVEYPEIIAWDRLFDLGKHQVHYEGTYDGEGTIAGTWSIPPLWSGPFAISPVVGRPAAEEGQEQEEARRQWRRGGSCPPATAASSRRARSLPA